MRQWAKVAPTANSARQFSGSLDDAKKRNDFFTFLHLKEAGSSSDNDHNTVVSFKPTAARFHDLIDLAATIDSNNTVVLWKLSIARSFIDDDQISLFAADFAKSFLQLAINSGDNDPAGDVIKELRRAQASKVPLIAARVPNTSV